MNSFLYEKRLLKLRKKGAFSWCKKIIRISAALDLALLETKETVSSYLDLRENPLEPTEDIQITGYPINSFGIPALRTVEKTGKIIPFHGGGIGFLTNHMPLRGASGSPLLNSQGKVSGVLYAKMANFAIAVTGEDLKSFIEGEKGSECNDNLKDCVKKDMELLYQSAKQGNILSQRRMGFLMYRHKKLQRIKHRLQLIAQNSPQRFQHLVKFITKKPSPEFYFWLEKAAHNNDPQSQYMMGAISDSLSLHMMGFTIVTINLEERIHWFSKAADLEGFSPAIHELALGLLKKGKIEEAKRLLEESAKAGYMPSKHALALDLLKKGKIEEAKRLLEESAQFGYMPSKKAKRQLELKEQLVTLKDKCLSAFRN